MLGVSAAGMFVFAGEGTVSEVVGRVLAVTATGVFPGEGAVSKAVD